VTVTLEERVTNRAVARAHVMQQVRRTIEQLEDVGFTHYRVGEWANPETGRHFRVGYASDEWTISIGQITGRKVTPIEERRIDLRVIVTGDQPIPTPLELFEQILHARP